MGVYHNGIPLRGKIAISKTQWRYTDSILLVIIYIFLLVIQTKCQTIIKDEPTHLNSVENLIKRDDNLDKVDSNNHCHSCLNNSNITNDNSKDNYKLNKNINPNEADKENEGQMESLIEKTITTLGLVIDKYLIINKTEDFEVEFERLLDDALSRDRYVIVEGVEIKKDKNKALQNRSIVEFEDENGTGRAIFSKYTYEYRLWQKFRNFVDTHIVSINLPKAANLFGFRSFGLKKLFVPLLIGAQVFKSIILAMFLPSILGSFGKILGKGISHISAISSQASYPPVQVDDQDAYNNENKDIMGYETDPAGAYAYPDGQTLYANMADPNEVNDLANVDLSRFGAQKAQYVPVKNSYYKNQMAAATNNYKVFQKIPASSMILSNYDPFYSPLLSRLDGIFARLGLTPAQESTNPGPMVGGQSLSDIKLEACREQLICLMYSSPAKYAPYSNLISAQLSRELNQLRRPVSDNPEILRFFRYMRAARRGQEGVDCLRAHPNCVTQTAPEHTMIAAYQDINKLVTARKLKD